MRESVVAASLRPGESPTTSPTTRVAGGPIDSFLASAGSDSSVPVTLR